ncbi:DUF1801 domain-containing protein [Endozoicomonas sp. SM1973]|uniref:DUF1801 domain-containing protein n=1 Tax=Spartinivicinus marinus TaxID=2994442 RepID=A0A853ICZ0_9GAMM|nr:DUF1801 domain-containing protein [Spartinivicinus marinus]MCX4026199.1 DUF1801 domain-containing protein [Spartinivicinus marinus]NYZ67387.1 DUF1801 domain-containing protein [Spartinivicinus marinus]
MKVSENQQVRDFLNDIGLVSSEQLDIIKSIKGLFNNTSQDLTEEIKYGGLVFVKSSSLVGGVFPYKQHISIEFSKGADFSDPSRHLEGKGKRRRHLKIYEIKDIKEKDALFYIKQAISG